MKSDIQKLKCIEFTKVTSPAQIIYEINHLIENHNNAIKFPSKDLKHIIYHAIHEIGRILKILIKN